MNVDKPTLLSMETVAEMLNISKNSVQRAIKRGDLRSVQIGRRVLVERREVYDFIERSRTPR